MIKICICDDQSIVRDGLEMLMRLEKDIEVVGLGKNGEEAIQLAQQNKPDIFLMDLKMPGINGVEATRQIHAQFPDIKILVLTTYDDDEWLFDALRAGASGYLLKDTKREKVIEAIRGTVEGKSYIDPTIAGKLINQSSQQQKLPAEALTQNLTGREEDVLRLMAWGMTNAMIANKLFLSEGTVRNHVSAIFSKLNVSDRTKVVVLAIKHGLDN